MKLRTAGYFYNEGDTEHLEELGFTFREHAMYLANRLPKLIICGKPEINFSTLEELMAFVSKHGQVVLDDDTITIYDDYLE